MLERILSLPRPQRFAIFILIFGGGLFMIFAFTVYLINNASDANARSVGTALVEGIRVREFAELPDNEAYPATVAVAPDGRLYSGSYKTGALWLIDSAGQASEIPGSRDAIGSVVGLTVAGDGSLLIVDKGDFDPATTGGSVLRLGLDGQITPFATLAEEGGFVLPDDVAVDGVGNVYISDRGSDTVWRFNLDGTGATAWWKPPALEGVTRYDATGLAYDKLNDALLVSDGINDTIYRVPLTDPVAATLLYWHNGRPNTPGFDGLTMLDSGAIYIACLGQAGVARLDGDNLAYVAGLFRGAADVDYRAPDTLFVANWDQLSLAQPENPPRLPFTIDAIVLGG